MIPSTLDPLQYGNLQALSFGDVMSPDGRAHPMDGLTPVSVSQVPATVIPSDGGDPIPKIPGQGPLIPPIPTIGGFYDPISGNMASDLVTRFWVPHATARAVFIVLGVILLAIVAVRLTAN